MKAMILVDTAVHMAHAMFGLSIMGQALIHLVVNVKRKENEI